ncbi:hypothetical protein OEZ85_012515 [Tetradesmus obliquus]|uniref:EF-hand domain-containing protein n=1 Tax=Tetradesmus obliquus TaxID=3088 RepID=A0ABY8TTR4_TETOB|nr:hypothetical protein OEZ85_012515 [Tetradesmus obliquus]
MAEADEDEINLESLKLLKEIFEAADEDGSGELDIDEFCAKLGPHLGVNLKRQQVAQLFMKIDADAGGTVDWDEFTNYMFLEKAQAAAGDSAADNWRLFPADFRDKNEASAYHHEQVDRLYFCGAIDKYISCGRDGSFRLWNAADLKHVKTVNNGSSWITDCLYLPLSRKMVFTTMDRAITYYDINRGSYDLTGRVYASGPMGVPLSLHVLSGDAGERVVYGDTTGATVLLLCGSRELPARDLISTDNHKDYIYLHKEHSDWVTQVRWIPEVGLVSASLDATIKTFDINRERITHTCSHHAKGVHAFVWCKAYSCFASCGLERDVTVWHGTTGRKIGDLRGHTSSVCSIALDDSLNHVFTLSIDKSIKVWDLRNHRCLQTINEDDWVRHDDSQPSCIMYDSSRRRLVTAFHRPYVWQHKVITQDRTGHREPVRGALYNAVFGVVVSVDEGGTVCVWNLQDGCRSGRFTGGHGASRVTAISFDKKQRRLVTAANDGSIKMWNFNNGSMLRSFAHDQEPLEVSEVLFERDEKRGSDTLYAAGWNAKVFVWEDADEDVVTAYKTYEGHQEDIQCMAAYPQRQLLATGDYQGRINIWGLFTGERKSWLSHRAERYETGVEKLLWLPAFSPAQRAATASAAAALTASAASLASASADASSFFGKMLCTLPGAQGLLDVVTAACVDEQASCVVLGDSAGHICVYDISAGIDASSSAAASASFKQRAHWQAHDAGVSSVDYVPARPFANSSCGANGSSMVQPLIVSAGRESNVAVWTLDGGCVGLCGEHAWDLDRQDTWQDAAGQQQRPPRPEAEGMFLKVGLELGRGAPGQLAAAGSDPGGVSMATLVLQGRKQKTLESMVARPEQPHCQLKVHGLDDVEATAGEILKAAADKRKAKARHLSSSVSGGSHMSSWSGLSHGSRPGGFNWRQQHS